MQLYMKGQFSLKIKKVELAIPMLPPLKNPDFNRPKNCFLLL